MSYVNSVVDKVYVINLDKDTERLRRIDRQLRAQGIEYERFSAIVGSQVASDSRLNPLCNQFCTDGMKGCALSHHTIWERAIEHGYTSILIFEDDAIVPDDLNERMRSTMSRLPSQWDLVYIGCRVFCNNEYHLPNTILALKGALPETHDDDIKKVKGSLGAHAIIYRTSFLKEIIDEPITGHIDLDMERWIQEKKIKAYGLYPEMVTVNDATGGSNLSDTFPPILIRALNRFEFSNSLPIGWFLSENLIKVAGVNLNALVFLFFLLVCFAPRWLLITLAVWLLIEASFSTKGLSRYLLFFGLGLLFQARVKQNLTFNPFSKV